MISALESTVQDLRYAIRVLLKNPGFAAVVVLSLALGIGANTAIFSLIDAVLLRMLPVQEPESLLLIGRTRGNSTGYGFTHGQFRLLREHNQSFTDLAAIAEECPRGCTHLPDAPDCAIVEAVAEGRLGPGGAARLDSLQRLLQTFADKSSQRAGSTSPSTLEP